MATPKTRRVKQRAITALANAKGSTQTTFRTSESVLMAYQHEIVAVDRLRSTIALTGLVPYLDSLGAELPANADSAPQTRLLVWASADVIDLLPRTRQEHVVHEAFAVIANALGRFRDEIAKSFRVNRKRLTTTQTEHLVNLRHAENQFRELHSEFPSFRPWVYLHPTRLRSISLRQRGEFTDVIELKPPNVSPPVHRCRLHRLDKRGKRVPVVWDEFGFNLDDCDFIEDTIAGPRPGSDDIGPQLLGKLKRAVFRLDQLRSVNPDAMREPAWPERSLESARIKLSDIVAELDVDGKARENLKRGPQQRTINKEQRYEAIRAEIASIQSENPRITKTSACKALARRGKLNDGTPVGIRTIKKATTASKKKR